MRLVDKIQHNAHAPPFVGMNYVATRCNTYSM